MDDAFDALPQTLEDGRAVSAHLADVADRAKDYARASRAENTRRYQRKRDRFKVNLTKAAGL